MKSHLMNPPLCKEGMDTRMETETTHALCLPHIEGKADLELQIHLLPEIHTTTLRIPLTHLIPLTTQLSL